MDPDEISKWRKIRWGTTSDKVYVISCNKPQELTDLVRWGLQQK